MSDNKRNEIFQQGMSPSPGIPTRNVMQEDFGYEVPVEAVPLPSGGVVYEAESPLHGQQTIEIRAMTARDEDILTSRALIKKGTVITELLKQCMLNKSVNVDQMISGDRNAVMVALRVTGYGTEYNVEVGCPECGENSKQEFNLAELPIKRLKVQPIVPGSNLFEFTLPVTKKVVRFKFLTGQDETDMMTIQERMKKRGMTSDQLVTQRLQHQLVSVGGIEDKTKIQMFIRNMPARDSLALRRYIDEHEPGIDMKAWMDCPHCLETSEVRLPMGATFFWPDAE